MIEQEDLQVTCLGECQFPSPLKFDSPSHPEASHFLTDSDRIRLHVRFSEDRDARDPISFEEAGPRKTIFFDPSKTTAAIVTCGGLSPGLNNVIRSVFYGLSDTYGVDRVLGIRNGYLGLNPESGLQPITLTREFVEPIDKLGGTCLGSSRGPQEPRVMADYLQAKGIDILFCLGGDGTQRGAHALDQELRKRDARVSIVGIPKTIDNDVPFVRLSFGFATALEKAQEVVRSAHVEARGAVNGIGLVKLMGRHAGFIAAGTSVVSQEVDFTLVPEIPFPLDGDNGFLPALEGRMKNRGHAVIVVAEGAGQHLLNEGQGKDASGNQKLQDIGVYLKHRINDHFRQREIPIGLKYMDPSYFIRSCPASAYDRFLSDQMAREAVHAAMAGKTGLVIGFRHNRCIHVPTPMLVKATKRVEPNSQLWQSVLQVTGQPIW